MAGPQILALKMVLGSNPPRSTILIRFLIFTMNKGHYTRLVNWLINQGYSLTATSTHNSYYLNKSDITIRISDHIKSDAKYTFQIFLSPFGNTYSVFFERQFIPLNSLKELKTFILQSEIVLFLLDQKRSYSDVVLAYKQKYDNTLIKLDKEKEKTDRLREELNKLKQSNRGDLIKEKEKLEAKIGRQSSEIKRLINKIETLKKKYPDLKI